MSNRRLGNLEVIITKEPSKSCANNARIRLTSLNDSQTQFEKQISDPFNPQQKFKFDNIPLGHYRLETFYNGFTNRDEVIHVKFSGGNTNWKGHFRKARNVLYLNIRKSTDNRRPVILSEGTKSAVKAIMDNPNLSAKQKIQLIRNLPENIRDPKIANPYLTHDFDLSDFPMDKVIENLVIPADEMIRSIPPGQGTGYAPVDLGINFYQLFRDLWMRPRMIHPNN